MSSRKVRLRYWLFDAKQFTFWLTVAFVAGAGPNLAGAIHTVFLLVVTILAGVVAAGIWFVTEKKKGVGVYLHLPGPGDGEASEQLLGLIQKVMKKSHRDWFRAGPDMPSLSPQERANWAIRTVEHRLHEADILNDPSVPIFAYLHCRHEEAFCLGRAVSKRWVTSAFDERIERFNQTANPRISIDLRLKAFSDYGKTPVVHSLELVKMTGAASEPDLIKGEVVELSASSDVTGGTPGRLALLVYISKSDGFPAFRDNALRAAAGKQGTGYRTSQSDVCDNALIISVTSSEFFDELQRQGAERYVRQIMQYSRDRMRKLYGHHNIPVRLFTNAPSIVVFAIGTFMTDESSIVPYLPSMMALPAEPGDTRRVVAIIDGDDVGNGMESRLLAEQLPAAAEYSRQIGDMLYTLVADLSRIADVDEISTGGDSAIFAFPLSSLQAFTATLDRLRVELNFRVTCGYGYDSRAAYMALRVAKSSGKNRTHGYLGDELTFRG